MGLFQIPNLTTLEFIVKYSNLLFLDYSYVICIEFASI